MGPTPPKFVSHDDAQSASRPLDQSHEEHVQEDVAGHVANVDHQLVVHEGGGGEGDGHNDSSGGIRTFMTI